MQEPLEAGPVAGAQAGEGLVGGCTDRDVVGMSENAVWADVTTTMGFSSTRIRAIAETTSSKATSATPPSGRPSHS